MIVTVNGQNIYTSDEQLIVSESVDIYECEFEFDSTWDGWDKTAKFEGSGVTKEMILIDDKTSIPDEVIKEDGWMRVGVYGTRNAQVMPTIWGVDIYVRHGTDPESIEITPTPSIYAQILNLVNSVKDTACDVTNIVDAYSTSATYAVGDYCIYNSQLYRCTTAITTAEAWTAAHWTAVQLGEEVGDLRSAFSVINGDNVIPITDFDAVEAVGLTITKQGDAITIYGTSTATRFLCCFNGQNIVKTAGATFAETVPPGTYQLMLESETYESAIFAYTKTTFNNATYIRTSASGIIVDSDDPLMFGLYLRTGTNFGTSESPTVLTFKILKYEEKTNISDFKKVTETINSVLTAIDYIARNEIKNFTLDNDIEKYTDFTSGYINTSGDTIDTETVTDSDILSHAVIPCNAGDTFLFNCLGGSANALLYAFCDIGNNIILKSYATGYSQEYSYNYYANVIPVKAPVGANYVVVHHHNMSINGYEPVVYKMSDKDINNYIAQYITAELPYKPKVDWWRKVVYTLGNSIVINDSGVLKLSTDLGKTWNTGVNVSAIGEIANYHLFNNGTLAFFTTTKAYYTNDWVSYSEATCYESDGTAFTPETTNNFNPMWCHEERKIINGIDMYVFGNYDTSSPHLRPLVWYTVDRGHTYKIAYEFDLEETYPARHVHDVIYYEPADVFIVGTGDHNATECSIFSFAYDSANDSWTVTQLGGSSRSYKWANMAIYRDKIYYAYDNTPGAVKRCSFADIGDSTKHETIIDGLENDTLSIGFSKRGEMVIIQSFARSRAGATVPIDMTDAEASRVMYYSADRKTFTTVILPLTFINGYSPQSRILPLLNDGRCYIGTGSKHNRLPSLNIGDFLNSVGYRQAFKSF